MSRPRTVKNPGNCSDHNPAVTYQHEHAHEPARNHLPLIPCSVAKSEQAADTNGDAPEAYKELNDRPAPHQSEVPAADGTITDGRVHISQRITSLARRQ